MPPIRCRRRSTCTALPYSTATSRLKPSFSSAGSSGAPPRADGADRAPGEVPESQGRRRGLVDGGDADDIGTGDVGAELSGPEPAHAEDLLEDLVHPEEGSHVGIALGEGVAVGLPAPDEEIVPHGAQDEGLPRQAFGVEPEGPARLGVPHVHAAVHVLRGLVLGHDRHRHAGRPGDVPDQLLRRVARCRRRFVRGDHDGAGPSVLDDADLRFAGEGQQIPGAKGCHELGVDCSPHDLASPSPADADRTRNGRRIV